MTDVSWFPCALNAAFLAAFGVFAYRVWYVPQRREKGRKW